LSNNKTPNYTELVQGMLQTFQNMKCDMSLKIHFFHSHLNFFPENLGDVSDKHGERFPHYGQARYQGKWSPTVLTYSSVRQASNTDYKRKSALKRF
jgi:hypothetical protein